MGSYYILKIVHLSGVFLVFSALGGHMCRAALGNRDENQLPKFIGMFHKAGLLLTLLAGLGLLSKIGELDTFIWIIAKFFILAMLAIWQIYLYGKKEKLPWFGGGAILLGAAAAFFAIYRPF